MKIEGEFWFKNQDEYREWDRYANSHNHLLIQDYPATLKMFLNHLRRGINLNKSVA